MVCARDVRTSARFHILGTLSFPTRNRFPARLDANGAGGGYPVSRVYLRGPTSR
jgi:hypothetical protein